MKSSDPSIPTYDIEEVHVDASRKKESSEFFVYTNEEITVQQKMFRPGRSQHYSIFLNRSNELEVTYNLINYTLGKNALFIVHPGIIHAFKEVDQIPTIAMGFTNDFLAASMLHKKHADRLGFLSLQNIPLFTLSDEESESLYGLMQLLKNLSHHGHPFKEDMMYHGFNLFMLELAAITRKYRGNDKQGTSRQEDILLNFLKLLAANFKEERSVQFYASRLYMTPKHLSKTVKELTTKTCGEFIDEMVITEAKILLQDLSYSVAQVADHLHFSDQFFFSKFFKKRTGLSPKEYKNSL